MLKSLRSSGLPDSRLLLLRMSAGLVPSLLLLWYVRTRRRQLSSATAAAPPPPDASPPPPRAETAARDDSSDEEEPPKTEHEVEVWKKVNGVWDEYCLSPLVRIAAQKWVRQMADPQNKELERLRGWLLLKLNGKTRAPPPSQWQRGCPEILAGLRGMPLWPSARLPWLQPFEENFAAIRRELLALRAARGFQPLKIPNWASKHKLASPDGAGSVSHDAGDWNVYYLFLHEVKFAENCARCPETTKLLQGLGARSYQHAFFSALTPGTHILQHHGPTNKKLRVQLPIVGAEGSELRVADQLVRGKEGECILFDDSFEHEAWHRGDKTRIVLVFDVWHPDLTDREVQFLSLLQRSRMRAEMAAEAHAREKASMQEAAGEGAGDSCKADEKGDNFYQLLQEAKDLLPDNDWWVQ
ncbi:hypothetical protein AB1Y20_020800 [Prymnesium parvum]|uniref:Aspartyl/asparaginy/proline hydroxylase domain-containing protein n=1 Tax=Prymnesium parvum TaxID=97485 RepID=A0AB34JUL4_PRYPA